MRMSRYSCFLVLDYSGKLLSSWELGFCVVAALATYFSCNSERKVGKRTPPFTHLFSSKSDENSQKLLVSASSSVLNC